MYFFPITYHAEKKVVISALVCVCVVHFRCLAAGDDRSRTGTLPKHRMLDVLRSGVLGWLPWPALDLNRKKHPVVAMSQEQRARDLVDCFREKRAPASHVGAAATTVASNASLQEGDGGGGGTEEDENANRSDDLEEKEEVVVVGGRPFGPVCYLDLVAFLIVDATTGTTVDSSSHTPLKLPKLQQGPQDAAGAGADAYNSGTDSSIGVGGNGDGGIAALALLPSRARAQTLGLDPGMQQHLLELHRNLASVPRSPSALLPPQSSASSSSSSINPESPYLGGFAGMSSGDGSGSFGADYSSTVGSIHRSESFSPWLPSGTDAAAGGNVGRSAFGGQHVVDPAHFPHASSAPGTLTVSMAPYVDRRAVGGVTFSPSTTNDESKRKDWTDKDRNVPLSQSQDHSQKPSLYDPKYPPKVPHPASVLPSSNAAASSSSALKHQQPNPILSEALVDMEIDRKKDDLTTAAQVYRSRANKQKQLNLYLLAHAASGVGRSTPGGATNTAEAAAGVGGGIDTSTGLRVLYRPQNSQRAQSVPTGPNIGVDLWGDGAGGLGTGPAALFDDVGREGEDRGRFLPDLAGAAAASMPRQLSAPMLGPPGPPSASLSYSPLRGSTPTAAAAAAASGHPHSANNSLSGNSLELVSVHSAPPSEGAGANGAGGGSLDGSSNSSSVDSLAVGSIVWDEWAKGWAPIGGNKHSNNSGSLALDPLLRGRHSQQAALKQQQVQAKRRAAVEAKATKQAMLLAEREDAKNKQRAAERAIMAALSVR